MKRCLPLVILSIALCGLPACKKRDVAGAGREAALQVPAGFQHEATFDVAGFYTPLAAVQVGNFKLINIGMGAESDFAQWEAGAREGLFGPILIGFDDMTSPVVTNETGEGHEKALRLLPVSYRLYPGEVSFKATDPALGEVVFSGAFNQAALAEAKKVTTSGNAPVLIGKLQVAGQTFDGASFAYWAGD